MKPESLMLIADAKRALGRITQTASAGNPLVAGLLAWLLPGKVDVAVLASAAEKAAAAKGGERNSRGVAVLGFACAITASRQRFEAAFAQQLEWLIGRPNFGTGGEPSGVLLDPVGFLGVCVGAHTVLTGDSLARFREWALTACKDALGLSGDSGWRSGLLESLELRLAEGSAGGMVRPLAVPCWLRAALSLREWSTVDEGEVSAVLKTAIGESDRVDDGFEAVFRLAAVDWATARALDFNLSAMTVSDVARVLNHIGTIFQRWVWEDKPRTTRKGALPRQWHIDNEYHVQSLLYAVLKPILPGLEEEKYLAATGPYQPRADLCLLGLQLVIEVKFWYCSNKAKELIEQIAADRSLYLRPDSPYRKLVAVIWDDGARTEEHSELRRGLLGLDGIHEVVVVSRPALMSPVAVNPEGSAAISGKRQRKSE